MDKDYKPASNDTLAKEARLWDSGALRPADWRDAPDAVPRNAESKREGVGVGALAGRWVDERAIDEQANLEDAAAQRAE